VTSSLIGSACKEESKLIERTKKELVGYRRFSLQGYPVTATFAHPPNP
jgi:hypothetical protein